MTIEEKARKYFCNMWQAIPGNGTFSKSEIEFFCKNDFIAKRGYSSLCIEFKTPVGKQQEIFQEEAEEAGNKYVIVRSVKDAIDTLKWYLE